MRQKFSAVICIICFAIFASAFASACASVPKKERATQTLQSVHTVLGTLQDTEMSLFAAGTLPTLTPERHKAFHAALVQAFDAEEKVRLALLAWRAGDPAPASLSELQRVAHDILTLVQQLAPAQSTLVTAARAVVDTVLSLINTIRPANPAPAPALGGSAWIMLPLRI